MGDDSAGGRDDVGFQATPGLGTGQQLTGPPGAQRAVVPRVIDPGGSPFVRGVQPALALASNLAFGTIDEALGTGRSLAPRPESAVPTSRDPAELARLAGPAPLAQASTAAASPGTGLGAADTSALQAQIAAQQAALAAADQAATDQAAAFAAEEQARITAEEQAATSAADLAAAQAANIAAERARRNAGGGRRQIDLGTGEQASIPAAERVDLGGQLQQAAASASELSPSVGGATSLAQLQEQGGEVVQRLISELVPTEACPTCGQAVVSPGTADAFGAIAGALPDAITQTVGLNGQSPATGLQPEVRPQGGNQLGLGGGGSGLGAALGG